MKRLITIVLICVLLTSSLALLGGCEYFIFRNNDAGDYGEIYARVQSTLTERGSWWIGWLKADDYDRAPTNASPTTQESNTSDTSDGSPDYYDTNVQVEGVQEADIVKTDGQYIYVLSNGDVCIIKADNGATQLLSRITIDYYTSSDTLLEYYQDRVYASEMYVTNNRLIVIARRYVYETTVNRYYYNSNNSTTAYIYDITDRTQPLLIQSYCQSGDYIDSRMIDNQLYLISNHSLYYKDDVIANKPETYVPVFTEGDTTAPATPSEIIIPDNVESIAYLVVQSIDVSNQTECMSKLVLMDCGSNIYCSNTDLFVGRCVWEMSTDQSSWCQHTVLRRISLTSDSLACSATGRVNGYLLNQFSMDQKDGYLRVVTTYNDTEGSVNALYVLNDDLTEVGSITDLAQGETVYSVRFDGDVGYFVTFRQVDPLFAVDLSNPINPTLLSQLKIPGFSNYLHPYGEGLLFGIGMAATESGSVQCMKLSMFDVSDLYNMSEVSKLELTDLYYSEANYNHKALLINATRNLIGFYSENTYYVYTYDTEEGFTSVAQLDCSYTNDSTTYYGWYNMRGLYIDNYIYLVSDCGIKSFDMTNGYALCQTLVLYTPDYWSIND
ncbi:MAG: beta-propeller domain-containing protein [Clostridia bacterium]|nr:beta-propeller domain-containing protein [Clostridia bacterium]